MNTIIYFIRHAESPYVAGRELTRGLSAKGQQDAEQVRLTLRNRAIDRFYSSPYERAIRTIKPLAEERGQEIHLIDELKERMIGDITGSSFYGAKQAVYRDFSCSYPGGESSREAQRRGAAVIRELLNRHSGQTLVIGTHGDLMTLLLNAFNPRYDFDFWESTSMPDIYKADFSGQEMIQVTREWRA
ncbi:histidine phosphatase family protein ['Paenibacillus yunnanensis' Narsing Rao et al. 2020]|uniref:histidine phosphatase family protein n=1 Tax=Paenibacillus tengchongensis TaxID=2608684 RepID=UPI00124E560F|nr:histidine phosphatase family protein [Paenibacillus tengchongensis]